METDLGGCVVRKRRKSAEVLLERRILEEGAKVVHARTPTEE